MEQCGRRGKDGQLRGVLMLGNRGSARHLCSPLTPFFVDEARTNGYMIGGSLYLGWALTLNFEINALPKNNAMIRINIWMPESMHYILAYLIRDTKPHSTPLAHVAIQFQLNHRLSCNWQRCRPCRVQKQMYLYEACIMICT